MKIDSVLLVRTSPVVDKVDHPQFFDPCYHLKYIEARLRKVDGLRVHAHDCWIHPLDGAGLVALALELNADSIQVHFHTPYPGSPDWKAYREVFEDYDPAKMFHYAEPQFTLAAVSPAERVEELVPQTPRARGATAAEGDQAPARSRTKPAA